MKIPQIDMRRATETFIRRARAFAVLIGWLLGLVYRRRTWALVTAIALGVVWMTAQAGALGLVYGYAHILERTGTISRWHFSIDLRGNLVILLGVVGIAFALMAASAGAHYIAYMVVVRASGQAYREMLKLIVGNFWRLPDPRAPQASRITIESGITAFYAGARMVTSSAQILGATLPSLIGSMLATGALFWIDWKLTWLLALALVVQVGTVYMPSVRIAADNKREIEEKRGHSKVMRVVKRGLPVADISEIEAAIDGMTKQMTKSRGTRRRLRFFSSLASTAVLALAIAYIAASLMNALGEWPKYLVYIATLRVALNGITRSTSVLASISRFHERLSDFRHFKRELEHLDDRPLNPVDPRKPVHVSGRLKAFPLAPGSRIAVGVQGDHRDMLYALMDARQGGNQRDLIKVLALDLTEHARPDTLTVCMRSTLLDAKDTGTAWLEAAQSAGATVFIQYDGRGEETNLPEFGEGFALLVEQEDDEDRVSLVASGDANWSGVPLRLDKIMKASTTRRPEEAADALGEEEDEDAF